MAETAPQVEREVTIGGVKSSTIGLSGTGRIRSGRLKEP